MSVDNRPSSETFPTSSASNLGFARCKISGNNAAHSVKMVGRLVREKKKTTPKEPRAAVELLIGALWKELDRLNHSGSLGYHQGGSFEML
jgi:hypothetical protein